MGRRSRKGREVIEKPEGKGKDMFVPKEMLNKYFEETTSEII